MPNLNIENRNRILYDNKEYPVKKDKKRINFEEEGKSFLESFMEKKYKKFEKFIGKKRVIKLKRMKEIMNSQKKE